MSAILCYLKAKYLKYDLDLSGYTLCTIRDVYLIYILFVNGNFKEACVDLLCCKVLPKRFKEVL